jgi:hypothetical protein
MNTTYSYVVLRLAVDQMRGEVINVGIVLLGDGQKARAIMMATLNKLRAIDASWTSQKLYAWAENVNAILRHYDTVSGKVKALERFGFCESNSVGMFTANTDEELAKQLARIKATYVSNRPAEHQPKREKRTRLQTAMREQFKRMQVMGETVDDIAEHLVVSNVPVASYPELKSDFVYKNGTYRVTQTLDYHVAPDSLHNKLMEACVKSTAAELAMKEYGPDTRRLAVVDIPEGYLDATDSHLDLLVAQGFEVFHFNSPQSMTDYLAAAVPTH